jgi:hypothetical protein
MSVARPRTRSWLPSRPLARRSRGPLLGGVWLHCRTRRRARRLDSELAAGVDPMQSDELSLRVGQLRSAKGRRSLACALRGAVELAYRQSDPLRVPPPPIRREIRENRALLLELTQRVRSGGTVGATGLAMISMLVRDRTSPLNSQAASRSLGVVAYGALVALERGDPPVNARDR